VNTKITVTNKTTFKFEQLAVVDILLTWNDENW